MGNAKRRQEQEPNFSPSNTIEVKFDSSLSLPKNLEDIKNKMIEEQTAVQPAMVTIDNVKHPVLFLPKAIIKEGKIKVYCHFIADSKGFLSKVEPKIISLICQLASQKFDGTSGRLIIDL